MAKGMQLLTPSTGSPSMTLPSRRKSTDSRVSSAEYRSTELLGPVREDWAAEHPEAAIAFEELRRCMDWLEEGDRPMLEIACEARVAYHAVCRRLTEAEALPVDSAFWKRQTYNQWRARAKDLYNEFHDMLKLMNANGLYRQRRELPAGSASDPAQLMLPNVELEP